MTKRKKKSLVGWTDKYTDIDDLIYIHQNTETLELSTIYPNEEDASEEFEYEIKKICITIEEVK